MFIALRTLPPAGRMSNVIALRAARRWKAVLEYRARGGQQSVEHFFEEISELHLIVELSPDWNRLIRCTVTLNRPDTCKEQNSVIKARGKNRAK